MSTVYNRIGRIATPLPNWGQTVGLEYEFRTSIREARDGSEQREAMRQTARAALSYSSVLRRDGIQRHLADLATGQDALFVVPGYWRKVTLAIAANATDGTITVTAPAPFWLADGSPLVLFDGVTMEAVTASSVAGEVVTLAAPLVSSFATGSSVYYAYRGRVPANVSFRAETDSVWTSAIRFEVDPASDPQSVAAAVPLLFEGKEVLLTRPNWQERPSIDFRQTRDEVDFGVGRIEVSSPRMTHTYVLKLGFSEFTAASVEGLIAFFHRMKGRRGSFWMPTWQDDVTPRVSAGLGTSALEVSGSDFFTAFDGSDTYSVLAVAWPDGTYQVNRIASLGVTGSLDTLLTMADPWTKTVDATAQVMWCPLWRFASDVLEVRWLTPEIGEMSLAMQSLMNEAA